MFPFPAPGFPSLKGLLKSPANVDGARKTVEQSIVLLLNRNAALPVRGFTNVPGSGRKVVLLGPTGNSLAAQCGGWLYSFRGLSSPNPDLTFQNTSTIMQAVQKVARENNWDFAFEAGMSGYDRPDAMSLQRARNAASDADLIIICVGEPPHSEGTYPITDLYEIFSLQNPPLVSDGPMHVSIGPCLMLKQN
jgi:hypothetical protein